MRVGILTFHSQLNYGGVLQCWALQTTLKKMGHDVFVIDRWMDKDNWNLDRHYPKSFWHCSKKFILRSLLGLGDYDFYKRIRKTQKFINDKLHLTSYHLWKWEEAPKDLGVDIVVVGSDQVWNPSWKQHYRFYLLDGAPVELRYISYAASVGVTSLSTSQVSEFKKGLKKFHSISCREKSGVDICNELAFSAEHVLDPTLLVEPWEWLKLVHLSLNDCEKPKKRKLLCYFLAENVDENLPILEQFSRDNDCQVSILVGEMPRTQDYLPIPYSLRDLCRWGRNLLRRHFSKVRIMESYGPIEFVREHAAATWVLTDSFHSLMFSIIFNKRCHFIHPTTTERMLMFSRIKDIEEHVKGKLVAVSLKDALELVLKDENYSYDLNWFNCKRKESLSYLVKNLKDNA